MSFQLLVCYRLRIEGRHDQKFSKYVLDIEIRSSTTTSANNQAHVDEPSAHSTTETILASTPATDFNQKPPNIQKLELSLDPEKEMERLIQKGLYVFGHLKLLYENSQFFYDQKVQR